MEKRPDESVVAPCVGFPLMMMVTPGRGNPSSSRTRPVIVIICSEDSLTAKWDSSEVAADAKTGRKKERRRKADVSLKSLIISLSQCITYGIIDRFSTEISLNDLTLGVNKENKWDPGDVIRLIYLLYMLSIH